VLKLARLDEVFIIHQTIEQALKGKGTNRMRAKFVGLRTKWGGRR